MAGKEGLSNVAAAQQAGRLVRYAMCAGIRGLGHEVEILNDNREQQYVARRTCSGEAWEMSLRNSASQTVVVANYQPHALFPSCILRYAGSRTAILSVPSGSDGLEAVLEIPDAGRYTLQGHARSNFTLRDGAHTLATAISQSTPLHSRYLLELDAALEVPAIAACVLIRHYF